MRRAKWQVAADTWSGTKAKSFLSCQPPVPLPSSGPLHKLLNTTKRSLPHPTSINVQAVQEAVDTGAVLVLAKLAHWLQQRPCHELLGAPTSNTDDCFRWAYVVDMLAALTSTAAQAGGGNDALLAKFYEQLEASGEQLVL